MPTLTGTESVLSAALFAAIQTKLTTATGQPMEKAPYLQAVCDAIAQVLIPHLVTNIQVNPGQTVTGTTGPTALPLAPTPIGPPGLASTSTPGTIS